MAGERSRPKRRTHCPACDEPLDPGLAQSGEARCPACEQRLIPVEVAGAWRRAAGGLLDLSLLLLTAGLLNWALLSFLDLPSLLGRATGLNALLRMLELDVFELLRRYAPFLGMSALYFGLFWAITGQTPGARLLRIRVVGPHGRPPGPGWTLLRVLTHVLGAIPGALGWIWAAFDLEKRAWHDHAARTWVVKVQ